MGDAETLKEDALEEKEAAAESPGGQEVAIEAGVADHGGKVLQVFPEGPLPLLAPTSRFAFAVEKRGTAPVVASVPVARTRRTS